MRILIADDMEYARANIMEMVKKIFPEAEIDTFSDGTHAWEAVKKREYVQITKIIDTTGVDDD